MEIIRDTKKIAEMMKKTNYAMYIDIDTVSPDEQLDIIVNCCFFFDQKREEIQNLLGVPLDVVMYSWYYWGELFFATLGIQGRKDYGDGGLIDYLLELPAYIEYSGLEDIDIDFMEALSDEVNMMTKGGLDAYYNKRDS